MALPLRDVINARHASAEAIAALQAERLATLMQSARRLPFYRATLGPRAQACTRLADWPVVGKPQLAQGFSARIADPAVEPEALRRFCADPARIGEAFLGRYWVWESSGSTGEPGVFVQDETSMAVYDALEATRRDSPHPWARWFDPLYLGERFAFVGATSGHFASHVSVRRLCRANPWLAQAWRSFSILQPAEALVAQLNEFAPTILATYPTAAMLLAEEAEAGRLHIHPGETWTGGETLTPAMRARIVRALGGALRNSYGASEFLPIAWECRHQKLHVNADWVILEPVDAQHRPVAPGTVSHTTLLTNLANHLQPLLRVDIGDSIALGGAPCACGSNLPVLEVQGRCDDLLVLPGRQGRPVTLLPLALSTVLEDEAGVFDFQLRQAGPLAWQLCLGPGAAHDAATRERCRRVLADFAVAQGAQSPRVSTRVVPALPPGRSGKRQRIVAAASGRPAGS
jgi:phenylacetate-CoA ligase